MANGSGTGGGRVAEAEQDLAVVDGDVVEGEPDDPGDGLGVEEQQQRGDPVHRRDLLIGDGPADQRETAMPVERRRVAGGDDRQAQAGHVPGAHAPAQKLLSRASGQ